VVVGKRPASLAWEEYEGGKVGRFEDGKLEQFGRNVVEGE